MTHYWPTHCASAAAAMLILSVNLGGCVPVPVDRETPDWEIQPASNWYNAELRVKPAKPIATEVIAWPIGIRTVEDGGYVDVAFFGARAAAAASWWADQTRRSGFDSLLRVERLDGDRQGPTFTPRPRRFHHVGFAVLTVSGQFEEPVPSATSDPDCYVFGLPFYSADGWPTGVYSVQILPTKERDRTMPDGTLVRFLNDPYKLSTRPAASPTSTPAPN